MQAKERNISPIKQRILSFAATLGISKRDFYARIGVSRGTLESKTGITEDVITKFFAAYPSVSVEWLMTGEGNMFKQKAAALQRETEPAQTTGSENSKQREAIPLAEAKGQSNIKPIPLVTETAAAGFGNEHFSIEEKDVKEYYIIPKFRYSHVDFMIEVSGLSMYPHLCPGDVIACSILYDRAFLQWNKCHVIATREQGILVKRLMPSQHKNCLTAVSDNKEYPPFDIPLDEITGIALVVGFVRLE